MTPSLLFLVGYRGTGKSTVGSLLARRLRWQHLDADEILEARAGRSIRQIFVEEGEAGFRIREAALLEELCRCRDCVISTGGGVILSEANRKQLRRAGIVVWLSADAETIWQRLQADAATCERRPNLTTGGVDEVRELLQARESLYRGCADHVVDTAGRSPSEIVSVILGLLKAE